MRKTLSKLLGDKLTWQLLSIGLLVIALVAVLGAGWFGVQWFNGARADGGRTAAVDAARDGVEKFLTISPKTVDGDLLAVEKIAHGEFAEEWQQGEATLRKSVLASGASMAPEVRKAGYVKGDSDSVSVLLIADAHIKYKNKVDDSKDKKKDGEKKSDKEKKKDREKWDKDGDGVPDSRIEYYRIKVNMALVDGVWKIAKLELAK